MCLYCNTLITNYKVIRVTLDKISQLPFLFSLFFLGAHKTVFVLECEKQLFCCSYIISHGIILNNVTVYYSIYKDCLKYLSMYSVTHECTYLKMCYHNTTQLLCMQIISSTLLVLKMTSFRKNTVHMSAFCLLLCYLLTCFWFSSDIIFDCIISWSV